MFDFENEEALIKTIDNRHPDCTVIPLYVKISNQYYALWELGEITDFSKHTIKVGFGSSFGLFVKSPFPSTHMYDFTVVQTKTHYNDKKNVNVCYVVFESGPLTDDEIQKSSLHQEIHQYMTTILDFVEQHVTEYRQKLRKQLMEELEE